MLTTPSVYVYLSDLNIAANMHSLITKCLCVSLVVLLVMALVAEAQDMHGPPARPEVFKNPQELRDYLKALNEYFAIVGRPR